MEAINCEKELHAKIYKALNGDLVQKVISETSTSLEDIYFKSYVAGHSLPISKKLMPRVYKVCIDVVKALNYNNPVEFYLSSDADVNAFSLAPLRESEPAIISINSGLLKLMSDDELMFVIGHEIGHLINGDTALGRIFDYVYPEGAIIPGSIDNIMHLEEQLAELVADRWGYTAVSSKQDSLSICVSAMYKLSSGVNLLSDEVSVDELLAENKRNLKYFQESGVSAEDHPVNPIRIEAIRLYHTHPRNLKSRINKLTDILKNIYTNEDDIPMSYVISMFITHLSSNGVNVDEVWCDYAYQTLGCYVLDIPEMLASTAGSTMEDLQKHIEEVIRLDPSKRQPMIEYLCKLAFYNNNLNESTYNYVITVLTTAFNCSGKEIYQALGGWLSKSFTPSVINMI